MSNPNDEKSTDINTKKMTTKQIAALICVVLLVALYAVTFIAAIMDVSDGGRLFASCLAATIALPILLWILLHIGRKKD